MVGNGGYRPDHSTSSCGQLAGSHHGNPSGTLTFLILPRASSCRVKIMRALYWGCIIERLEVDAARIYPAPTACFQKARPSNRVPGIRVWAATIDLGLSDGSFVRRCHTNVFLKLIGSSCGDEDPQKKGI